MVYQPILLQFNCTFDLCLKIKPKKLGSIMFNFKLKDLLFNKINYPTYLIIFFSYRNKLSI